MILTVVNGMNKNDNNKTWDNDYSTNSWCCTVVTVVKC